MRNIKYVIISPVRNEGAHIERTIASVTSQTLKPVEWIIVDDGSTDQTSHIISKYTRQMRWMRVITREDRGSRKPGAGVMEAFNQGYTTIKQQDFDYIVKLDGDLSFGNDYFSKCFEHFNKDKMLGIGGGQVDNLIDGKIKTEHAINFYVRGACKIYSRACWDAIGGLPVAAGWDTYDSVKANMLGFTTRSFAHPRVLHHKATGSAEGFWRNSVKHGQANYTCGYSPLFMFCKAVSRIPDKPFFIGSLALLWGFLSCYAKRTERIADRLMIHYVRRQQHRKLLGLSSVWK